MFFFFVGKISPTWPHFFMGKHPFERAICCASKRGPRQRVTGRGVPEWRKNSAAVRALHQATEEKHQVSVSITPNARPRAEPKAPASPRHCTQDAPSVASTRGCQNLKTSHLFFDCPNTGKGWEFLILEFFMGVEKHQHFSPTSNSDSLEEEDTT